VLFPVAVRRRIAGGEVTVAFRRWKRPTVKGGGTLRTPIGVLGIDSVERIAVRDIAPEDIRAAGFASRAELLRSLAPAGALYRVEFHLAGPDPRLALRERASLDDAERAELAARLEAMDRRSTRGPWTGWVLDAIAERPGTRAPDLAAELGWETKPFKANVRRLKELGLTESLEVGYRLSPRGRAFRSG
jgi:hypothetical protein